MGMQSGMLLSVAASEVCTLQRRRMRQSAICCSAESSHHIPRNGIVSEQSTPFESNVHAYMLHNSFSYQPTSQRVNGAKLCHSTSNESTAPMPCPFTTNNESTALPAVHISIAAGCFFSLVSNHA